MHLFIDESGGTDRKNDVFFLAGIILPARDARRVRDRIHGALQSKDWMMSPGRLPDELKSHSLTRLAAFNAFMALDEYHRIVVRLHRRKTAASGWVFSQVPEHVLYERMAATLVRMAGMYAPIDGVTLDRTRYKRSIETHIRSRLVKMSNVHLPVLFSDSAGELGVQLADVCANTCYRVYRAFERGRELRGDDDLPTYAPRDVVRIREGGLIEADLDIDDLLPEWLKPSE